MDGPDQVAEHQALVQRIANEVASELGARAEMADLLQAGFEGLLETQAKFDPERAVPFAGFAYRRIRGSRYARLRHEHGDESTAVATRHPAGRLASWP